MHVNPCGEQLGPLPQCEGGAHAVEREAISLVNSPAKPLRRAPFPQIPMDGVCCQMPATINSYQLWERSTYSSKRRYELLTPFFGWEQKVQRGVVMSLGEAGSPVSLSVWLHSYAPNRPRGSATGRTVW